MSHFGHSCINQFTQNYSQQSPEFTESMRFFKVGHSKKHQCDLLPDVCPASESLFIKCSGDWQIVLRMALARRSGERVAKSHKSINKLRTLNAN